MGERFGDYELIRKIAAGGMAEIFLARLSTAEGFGRPVVVKRMLPQLAVRDDFVTMFLDEARLAANLTHPNIVQVFNLGEHDGAYFMAMELIDGPHLGALFAHSLRKRRALPLEYCAYAVARSADGLDYAHDRADPATGQALNIVHRDISPQNILVSRHGDVKVTDFGVAKAETQESKTRTGIIKGKVSYMSPEQCLGDKVDRQTDVFALGIVLYELLTRRRLFRDKSDMLVMQRITSEDVPPPSSVNPKVDPELDAITMKALSRSKASRFASAAELSEALDIWSVSKGHTNLKASLGRWMSEHASELGLQIDGELSDPGSRPSWMDMQVGDDTPHPSTPQDGTASTPALRAVPSASGLPLRKIGDDDSGEATLVADERTMIDPAVLGAVGGEPTAPDGESLVSEPDELVLPASLSSVNRNAPAPSPHPDEARRPIAAMVGGGVALGLAVLIGIVALTGGGEELPAPAKPTDVNGDGAVGDGAPPVDDPNGQDTDEGDPDDGKAPGQKTDEDTGTDGKKVNGDGVDQGANTKHDEQANGDGDGAKAGDGEDAGDDNTETVAVAPKGPVLKVVTLPDGVPVEVGRALHRSPWEGHVAAGALKVRALFSTGAVEHEVLVDDEGQTVTLYESVPLDVLVQPSTASWTVKGPDLDIQGTGSKPLAGRLQVGETYQASADASGYERERKSFKVEAGKPVRLQLDLDRSRRVRRSSPASAKGSGTFVLFSDPFVKVTVNGSTHNAPVRGLTLPAKTHRVTVSNPQLGISQTFRVTIDKDKETRVKLRWEQKNGKFVQTKKDIGRPR